jgi:hypothetical protein
MRKLTHIFALAVMVAVPAIAVAGEPVAATAASQPTKVLVPDVKTQNWFGVAVENIPPTIAKHMKLKPSQGLMVSAVLPGSPAEKAGLKPDDLLIEINDKPLTAQGDLFEAANPQAKGKAPEPVAASRITFLREGDRSTVEIMPERRPATMTVFTTPGKADATKITNYVVPNGGGAQVGPGYILNLATSGTEDFTAKSIKAIVEKGQTIVLSQETDLAGNVKNTITVGTTTHVVDPANIGALPANLQPLAKQLVEGTPGQVKPQGSAAAPKSTEDRLKELEAKNAELQQQIEALRKMREAEKGSGK